MKIQVNSDNNIKLSEEQLMSYSLLLEQELRRFSDNITRLEIHFSDEDGIKSNPDSKRCLLEARLERMAPIAATASAATINEALTGAIPKLKNMIESIRGRFSQH